MKAVDQVVNKMLANLKELREGEYGELSDLGQHLEPAEIDIFMNPDPDAPDTGPVELEADHLSVLGRYYPMQSPGTVILYSGNLKRYFDTLMSHVLRQTRFVTKNDLSAAAKLVTLKTYYHEIFHFDCNVLRLLYGSAKDPLKEEALAVACSRRQIIEDRKAWQSQIGRMNGVIYSILMEIAFDYRSPGYRDWHLCADDASFRSGLLDYIQPPQYQIMLSNGVPVQEILFSMLGKGKDGQGFIERVA